VPLLIGKRKEEAAVVNGGNGNNIIYFNITTIIEQGELSPYSN
jgi:hypothetical protein